jgi:hypothetical protein
MAAACLGIQPPDGGSEWPARSVAKMGFVKSFCGSPRRLSPCSTVAGPRGRPARSVPAASSRNGPPGGRKMGVSLDDGLGRDHAHRPRGRQAAVQRDAVEDLHRRPPLDHQTFDDVEAVEFGAAIGHVREVPPGGRGGGRGGGRPGRRVARGCGRWCGSWAGASPRGRPGPGGSPRRRTRPGRWCPSIRAGWSARGPPTRRRSGWGRLTKRMINNDPTTG